MSVGEKSFEEFQELIRKSCDYVAALYNESDRGAAVLAAASFEHALEDAIARRFGISESGDDAKPRRDVLKRQIRHFAAKIDIAYAIGLFDESTHRGLRTVLEIRNKFAHSRDPLTFDHKPIADLCQNLNTEMDPGGSNDLRRRYMLYLTDVYQKITLSSPPPPFRYRTRPST